VLAALFLLPAHYTLWAGPTPPGARAGAAPGGAIGPAAAFTPFLDIVPSAGGNELQIRARTGGPLGGQVVTNINEGPTGYKGSWTMTFSDPAQLYVTTATGFSATEDTNGTISITTTLGLDTGTRSYTRARADAFTPNAEGIGSAVTGMELLWPSADTFTTTTHLAIAQSFGPPGPAPAGLRLVGSSYSARASGALAATGRPMLARLYSTDEALAGADPATLAIFFYGSGGWERLGGQLSVSNKYVSLSTARFGTYALTAAEPDAPTATATATATTTATTTATATPVARLSLPLVSAAP
jgi:hypothetical protein